MKPPPFPRYRICLLCLAPFVAVLLATLGGCGSSSKKKPPVIHEEPYLERRAKFQTVLTKRGPAPQDWEHVASHAHVRKITYPSGDLQLQGWVFVPPGAEVQPSPALIYCHGGFAFSLGSLTESCQPFIDAGFVVFCPTLRGENGNPGEFEMFCGEIDDAANAVRWLAEQPYVDKNYLYTFGHSAGGAVSGMLSLMDAVPIRHGGSCGGLYDGATFREWDDIVPFDARKNTEAEIRVLHGNQKWMKCKHYAFVGKADLALIGSVVALKREREHLKSLGTDTLLFFGHPAGDHFTSLEPSMRRYLNIVLKELPTGMTDVLAANVRSLSMPHLPKLPRHVVSPPSPGTLPGKPADAGQAAEAHRKFIEEQRERSKARMEEMRNRNAGSRNSPPPPPNRGPVPPGFKGFGNTDDENPFESGQTAEDDDDENPFR